MNEIEKCIKPAREISNEKARLFKTNEEAEAEKTLLLAQDVTTPESKVRFEMIESKFALVKSRLRVIAEPEGEAFRNLLAALIKGKPEHNKKVRDLRAKTEGEIVATCAKWFGGSEQRARKFLIQQGVPFDALREVSRCAWNSDVSQYVRIEDLVQLASRFLSHTRACAKRFPELG